MKKIIMIVFAITAVVCSSVVNPVSTKASDIYGTYQHAASHVTLSQSKSYSFSSAGLGNVLYYSNSSIRSKYDNTRGLYLNYRYGEEFE